VKQRTTPARGCSLSVQVSASVHGESVSRLLEVALSAILHGWHHTDRLVVYGGVDRKFSGRRIVRRADIDSHVTSLSCRIPSFLVVPSVTFIINDCRLTFLPT
jgi:hypothetical protein